MAPNDVNANLQLLLASVGAINDKLVNIDRRLETVEELQRSVTSLRVEVDKTQKKVNELDQDSRACLIRITGLSVSEAEMRQSGYERAIMKKTYERLLKPILNAAKTAGDLDSVPVLLNVLEQGYVAGKPVVDRQGRTLPPVINVRFTNRYIRNTVMRYKREHIPAPTAAEAASGVTRFTITEDLTQINARLLKEVRENDKVARAWSVDGRIRYTLKADMNTVKKYPSASIPVCEVIV